MVCPECGTELEEGCETCTQCGFPLASQSETKGNADTPGKQMGTGGANKTHPGTGKAAIKKHGIWKKLSVWNWCSVASLVCAVVTFFKGVDRMVNYSNPDSAWGEYVNVYVGGDAYNYIINGTHATAFFVLTTMFVLAAIGLLIVDCISKGNKAKGG